MSTRRIAGATGTGLILFTLSWFALGGSAPPLREGGPRGQPVQNQGAAQADKVQICSGTVVVRGQGTPLASGAPGLREQRVKVPFPRPFRVTPKVIVSLQGFQYRTGRGGQVIMTRAQSVTKFGFELTCQTWGGCVVAEAHVAWCAYAKSALPGLPK